jgi:hypothetical protein
MASIIHLTMNFGLGAVGILGLLPSPREAWIIVSVLYALYAVIVTVAVGPARLSRSKDVKEAVVEAFAGAS